MNAPIFIVSAGVVSSVGLTAASTCAAIRGSLSNFRETYFIDELGQPIVGAAAALRPRSAAEDDGALDSGGDRRLAAMFAGAASECLRGGKADVGEVALVLICPETERPGCSQDEMRRRLDACEGALGSPFRISRIVQQGRAGLAEAVEHARELLTARSVSSVLVAATDSLLGVADIEILLAHARLRTSENADGLIAGEAAACVLLTRKRHSSGSLRGEPVLALAGAGTSQEPAHVMSSEPNFGRGLALAIRQALERASLSAHELHTRLSDCSGESFFFDESAYAWGRVLRAPSPAGHRQLLVALSVGDVGVAAGPLMLALALEAARRGWARGRHTLVQLSGSGASRGAIITSSS